jgi:hypothetical protein
MYSPVLGRFLQRDPVDSLNLYEYAFNDPVNWIDPFGEEGIFPMTWQTGPVSSPMLSPTNNPIVIQMPPVEIPQSSFPKNANPDQPYVPDPQPQPPQYLPQSQQYPSPSTNKCPGRGGERSSSSESKGDSGKEKPKKEDINRGGRKTHGPKKQSTGSYKGAKKETHEKNHPGRGNIPRGKQKKIDDGTWVWR